MGIGIRALLFLTAMLLSLPVVACKGGQAVHGKSADTPEAKILLERARKAETTNGASAIHLYKRSVRAGSGEAALRLSEVYDKGLIGVERNYGESVKWANVARALGADVSTACGRG